jgi:hypothetical protein
MDLSAGTPLLDLLRAFHFSLLKYLLAEISKYPVSRRKEKGVSALCRKRLFFTIIYAELFS